MTEHADRIWAAAQVLNEVAETEDQSGAINDLLAVANALRSTPAAPLDHAADCRSMATKANGDCTCGYLAPAAPQPVNTDLLRAALNNAAADGHEFSPGFWNVVAEEYERLTGSTPAAPQPDTALTVERLARARATDGGWKEPNVTDRKWAEQFLAILRALGEGVGEGVDRG